MKHENMTSPRGLAVDTPSKKMLQFLSKHYGLKAPIFAPNNFVIFPGFFSPTNVKAVYQDFRKVPMTATSQACQRTCNFKAGDTMENNVPHNARCGTEKDAGTSAGDANVACVSHVAGCVENKADNTSNRVSLETALEKICIR